jgi:hypothetical protein
MKIDDDHMYHGSALLQIAEHPQFTAINSLYSRGKKISNSFMVNTDTPIMLKYASEPKPAYEQYVFTFTENQLHELEETVKTHPHAFIVLVLCKDREICCLSNAQLSALIERRKKAKGSPEPQYIILVTAPLGKSLRCYINAPDVRKKYLGKELIVSRNAFPNILFKNGDKPHRIVTP